MSIFYKENAFRILLVSANATRSEILDAYQSLRARARVGGMQPPHDPLSSLNSIERNELTLRDALNRIDNPLTRIRERMFWLIDVSSGRTSWTNLIGNGKPDSANQIESVTDIPSRINLAILKHSTCIATDPTAKNPSIWENALSEWDTLITDTSFWGWTQTVEQKSGFEPCANSAEIEYLRSEAWYLVLGYTRQQIHLAFETKKYDDLKRHQILTHFITSQSSIARRILSEILNPIEDLLEEKQKQILADLNIALSNQELTVAEKKNACDQSYKSYLSTLVPLVEEVVQIAGVDTDESRRAREKAASCLREIAVTGYNNALRDYEMSEKLLKDSEAMAFETLYADRLNEDLKVVSGNAAQVRYQKQLTPLQSAIDAIANKIPKLDDNSMNAQVVREQSSHAVDLFDKEIYPLIENIINSDGEGSELVIEAKRIVASFLRDVAITHHKSDGLLGRTQNILEKAKRYASDPEISGNIDEDLSTIAKLLHKERLYNNLKPLKDAPLMGTGYGIGSKLYGQSDYDAETQSYLTTLYFVLFYIPLFPRARYRVIDVGNNTYRFLGRASFRKIEKLHTACFALSICLMVYWMYWESTHATLYLDNGTGNSMSIAFQNLDTILSPPGLKIVRIPVGRYSVQYLNVRTNLNVGSSGIWIFNPSRVNYYRRYRVYYGSSGYNSSSDSYLGNPELLEAKADYVFQSAPSSISSKSSGESRVVLERTHPVGNDDATSPPNENANRVQTNENPPRSFDPDTYLKRKKEELMLKITGYRERLRELETQLGEIDEEIKSYKEQIDTYANTIKRIERDNNLGYDVDRDEYNTALSNHNYYVELNNTALSKYKSIYSEYEDLLQVANEAINKYNGE